MSRHLSPTSLSAARAASGTAARDATARAAAAARVAAAAHAPSAVRSAAKATRLIPARTMPATGTRTILGKAATTGKASVSAGLSAGAGGTSEHARLLLQRAREWWNEPLFTVAVPKIVLEVEWRTRSGTMQSVALLRSAFISSAKSAKTSAATLLG